MENPAYRVAFRNLKVAATIRYDDNMKCRICKKESPLISQSLSLCIDCIRDNFPRAKPYIIQAHIDSRKAFHLEESPPRSSDGINGIKCNYCTNECLISAGNSGYCGTRKNIDGQITGGMDEANLSWYYDPLPTNCVADWVCAAGTGAGFPEFALRPDAEYGYKNLAVFYHSCTFDCLFCQNWHYRREISRNIRVSTDELAGAVDNRTSCICYFGGDPAPSIIHSIQASKTARNNKRGILRICWETNGSMNPVFLMEMAEIALESGGCIKFDIKAYDEELHLALTGISNRRTFENIFFLRPYIKKRKSPPLFIASTLLVPGYIDSREVRNISRFLASISPDIPYTLLAFYPQFYMHDLPTTSRQHAQMCYNIAKQEGLDRVRIGNLHLLRDYYEMD